MQASNQKYFLDFHDNFALLSLSNTFSLSFPQKRKLSQQCWKRLLYLQLLSCIRCNFYAVFLFFCTKSLAKVSTFLFQYFFFVSPLNKTKNILFSTKGTKMRSGKLCTECMQILSFFHISQNYLKIFVESCGYCDFVAQLSGIKILLFL